MELKEVTKIIKTDFPNRAIDISEALALLEEAISDTIESIGDKNHENYHERNFKQAQDYLEIASKMSVYERKIDDLIDCLDVENLEIKKDLDEEAIKKMNINYEDYLVDSKVEHTLMENFTNKKPTAFKINDQKLIKVTTWREMLVKTAEILLAIDEAKFLTFDKIPEMNGKKMSYFSKTATGLRNPVLVSNKIFIECYLSANGIRNLIIKMLRKYKFKVSEYKIYLRADYSNLTK